MTAFISLFSIFFPTIIFPQSHKILRNKYNYVALLIMSILFLVLSLTAITDSSTDVEKRCALMPICTVVFLLLYKVFDQISLKKYDRHIYFHTRYNSFWEDGEADEATWLEFLLQFTLCIIPILVWWKIGVVIYNIN